MPTVSQDQFRRNPGPIRLVLGPNLGSGAVAIPRRDGYLLGSELHADHGMFTGLIEEVGTALEVTKGRQGQLRIRARSVAAQVKIGDSVAVNGCCLTIVEKVDNQISFDLLQETLERTNLRTVQRESRVNIEPALSASGRIGGHFVQGHVDCTAQVIAAEPAGPDLRLEIELPPAFAHYVTSKGSIAVNGVSLTIAEHTSKSFTTWIIPHTQSQTNLGSISDGALVNLEFDLIAKYLERLLDRRPVSVE